MRVVIKIFQLIKEEECRAFPTCFYFKLKEKYSEDIPKFNSDEEIEVRRTGIAGTIFNKRLEFAEYLYEI